MKPVLLNGTYAIEKTYTKPYASCRYTHPAVEAAIRMRSVVKLEEVKEIVVKTYDLAVSGHDHTDIHGSYSAKMSIPYSTAAGFVFGKAGLQEFSEEEIKNSEVLSLTKKVKVVSDENLSASFPKEQTAIVEIRTTDGRKFTERVDYPTGEPENPMTDKEFKEKYDGLFAYAGYEKTISDKIYDYITSGGNSVRELLEML